MVSFDCFSGVIGEDYEGDTAIDDIIFSPGCSTKFPPVFPRIPACEFDEFQCRNGGNCRSNDTKCDGKLDCKDGSDESGCGGGKSGKQKHSNAGAAAGGAVGGILALILVIVVVCFVVKRRRSLENLFKISYDSGKQEIQPSG